MANYILFSILAVSIGLNIILGIRLLRRIKALNSIKRAEKLLFQLGDEIIKINNMDEVFDRILKTAIKIIPNADKGSLLVMGDDNKFHFQSVVGYPEELKELVLERDETYLHKINGYKEAAIIREPMQFDRKELLEHKASLVEKHTGIIHCTISTPIFIDDKLVAVLNIDSAKDNRYFKKYDINLMNHIKNQLQLCLKNSYMRGELIYRTKYDDLTGIFNRRYFNEKLLEQLQEIKNEHERSYLVEIDLDDFKGINDCYGHAAGDSALILFSKVLKECLTDKHLYGRMSGDEFVIFFRNISIEEVYKTLDEIEKKLADNSERLRVLFSYGVTSINITNAGKINDIYAAADMEMYKNKKMRKLWISCAEDKNNENNIT
ncbi:sensor domain-containing diguanylate cyclase [Clostridium thermarum]|uniref:sensor domain-containing diguanylate cyclase n=1 Tax=Clostridium thermarum TaxID=1716543 RepID=UPI001121A964|nr:sensor domain-containing diguanylate cyclase [Clostridium thermarum]